MIALSAVFHIVFGWPFAVITLLVIRAVWSVEHKRESIAQRVDRTKLFPYAALLLSAINAAYSYGLRVFVAYTSYMLSFPTAIGGVLLIFDVIKYAVLICFSGYMPILMFRKYFSQPHYAIQVDDKMHKFLIIWSTVAFCDVLYTLLTPSAVLPDMMSICNRYTLVFWLLTMRDLIALKPLSCPRVLLCRDTKISDQGSDTMQWVIVIGGKVFAVVVVLLVLVSSPLGSFFAQVPGGLIQCGKNLLVVLVCLGYFSSYIIKCDFQHFSRMGFEGELMILGPLIACVALTVLLDVQNAVLNAPFLFNLVGSSMLLYCCLPIVRMHRALLILSAVVDITIGVVFIDSAVVSYATVQLLINIIELHLYVLLNSIGNASGIGERQSLLPMVRL